MREEKERRRKTFERALSEKKERRRKINYYDFECREESDIDQEAFSEEGE